MANKSGIHIKPSHKGLLTKEVDKKSGNVAKEKREVFALNAKTKFKHK